jgi:hypothetical protein
MACFNTSTCNMVEWLTNAAVIHFATLQCQWLFMPRLWLVPQGVFMSVINLLIHNFSFCTSTTEWKNYFGKLLKWLTSFLQRSKS